MAIGGIVLALLALLHLYKGDIVNVALKKQTEMSSVNVNRDLPNYVSKTGVDGIRRTSVRYIIHTAIGQSSGWRMVDLQILVQDATVKMYFRTDYTGRRNGVQMYTSPTPFSSYPEGQLCYTLTGNRNGSDIPDVVAVNCTGTWRYLLVFTDTDNDRGGPSLDFAEVEVLACASGQYGVNCVGNCGHCNGTCDVVDGRCPGGCLNGYGGTQCRIKLTYEAGTTSTGSVTSYLIGGVIGVIMTLFLGFGLMLLLVRQGSLQWVGRQTIDDSTQSAEMANLSRPSAASEFPPLTPAHVDRSDYAELDTAAVVSVHNEQNEYEAIKSKNDNSMYVNVAEYENM